MIDERFSKEAFDALKNDSEGSRILHDQLDREIHTLLMELLAPTVQEISEELNSMGFALQNTNQGLDDGIDYCEPKGDKTERYRMLFCTDVIITICSGER
jgi:hypothetical protein